MWMIIVISKDITILLLLLLLLFYYYCCCCGCWWCWWCHKWGRTETAKDQNIYDCRYRWWWWWWWCKHFKMNCNKKHLAWCSKKSWTEEESPTTLSLNLYYFVDASWRPPFVCRMFINVFINVNVIVLFLSIRSPFLYYWSILLEKVLLLLLLLEDYIIILLSILNNIKI